MCSLQDNSISQKATIVFFVWDWFCFI
uniref:Uncharacterized protein n=1 Tax=Anguilla anguilla TaxID=7936 RepID=A0A0E9VKY2_ANGAN